MQRFVLFFFLVNLSLCWSTGFCQKADWFRDQFSPTIPYGGESELKAFVEQIMVYPKQAIDKQIEGNVFINYVVNLKGKVVSRETNPGADTLLSKEALRIFDRIVWEAKPDANPNEVVIEKLRIQFSISKYKRLVKRRGYDSLPYIAGLHYGDSTFRYYSINEVDQRPSIKNYSSINAFVRENFNYPSIALQREISGRVTLEFIIEPYGMTSNVRIVEALAGGCNAETIRLVKAMLWNPGIKEGLAVRTIYKYQLNFVHPGGNMH